MIENIKEGWNVTIFVFILAIAGVGGALGSMMRSIDKEQRIRIGFVLLESAASMFAGTLIVLLFYALGWSWEWAGITAGLGGWMGGRVTMQRLDKFLEKKFGSQHT